MGLFDDDYRGEGYTAFHNELAEVTEFHIDRAAEQRRALFSASIKERDNLSTIFNSIESEIVRVITFEQQALLRNCVREGRNFIAATKNYNPESTNYTQFMKDAGNYLNALMTPEPSDSLNKKQSIFLASADELSKDVSPNVCDKFKGAVLAFVGAIIALATLFCIRNVARDGYRLFSGSEAKAVDSFKRSILESASAIEHNMPRLAKA